jgi:hypothetical protein
MVVIELKGKLCSHRFGYTSVDISTRPSICDYNSGREASSIKAELKLLSICGGATAVERHLVATTATAQIAADSRRAFHRIKLPR